MFNFRSLNLRPPSSHVDSIEAWFGEDYSRPGLMHFEVTIKGSISPALLKNKVGGWVTGRKQSVEALLAWALPYVYSMSKCRNVIDTANKVLQRNAR